MYEQVDKPKENKSREVANSVAQKHSSVRQGLEFVDNRAITQLMFRVGKSVAPLVNNTQFRFAWTKATDPDAISHFNKHGGDFGATTVQQYHNMVKQFTSTPTSSTQIKTGLDGKKYFFDANNNYFAVMNQQNKYATFFKPDPAKHGEVSNQDYFDTK